MAIAVEGSASWIHTTSVSHTTQVGTDLLVVTLQQPDAAPSGVTFNGVSLTLARADNIFSNRYFHQYYLQNPPIGTYTLAISVGGGTPDCFGNPANMVTAINLSGAETVSSPVGGSDFSGGISSPTTRTVTPTVQGAAGIIIGFAKGDGQTPNSQTLSLVTGTSYAGSTQYRDGGCHINSVGMAAYNTHSGSDVSISISKNSGVNNTFTIQAVEYMAFATATESPALFFGVNF